MNIDGLPYELWYELKMEALKKGSTLHNYILHSLKTRKGKTTSLKMRAGRTQMRTIIWLSFVVLLLIIPQVAFPGDNSALNLLSACRAIAKGDVKGDYIGFHETYESGLCWGTFATIQKMTRYCDSSRKPFFRICAPSESKRSQLVAVFVNYAEKNPQRLHEDFFVVALDSLRQAFPCK
jgi:hypothetical protein